MKVDTISWGAWFVVLYIVVGGVIFTAMIALDVATGGLVPVAIGFLILGVVSYAISLVLPITVRKDKDDQGS